MSTVLLGSEFEVLTCSESGCGMQFAAPVLWVQARRRDHAGWFCPNGHSRYFPGESDLERAKRLHSEAEQQAEHDKLTLQARLNDVRHEAEVLRRQVATEKGKLTRIKNRIHRGVCTCCNRTFQNLANHIRTQHPEQLDPSHERKQITA